jgi:hypothetical protein
LSVPTFVVAFFLVHATPFEILVAECAAGAMTAVEATSSAASATEVLRNIFPPITSSAKTRTFNAQILLGSK